MNWRPSLTFHLRPEPSKVNQLEGSLGQFVRRQSTKYVDLYATLVAVEGLEWFPVSDLDVETPYDASNDVEIYYRRQPAPARVDLYPGTFVDSVFSFHSLVNHAKNPANVNLCQILIVSERPT